jgi:hypothetical protein
MFFCFSCLTLASLLKSALVVAAAADISSQLAKDVEEVGHRFVS